MTQNFDYKKFAENIKQNAENLLSDEIKDKEYIINSVYNFTLTSAEALSNDSDLMLDEEQIIFISRNVAKYIFEKAKDLELSYSFDKEKKDIILQNVAYIVFEIAREHILSGRKNRYKFDDPDNQVNKTYLKAIDDILNPKEYYLDSDFEIDLDEYSQKLKGITNAINANPDCIENYEERVDLCETICSFIEEENAVEYRKLLIEDYQKLIELKPEKSSDWYYFLYKSYYHLGNNDEAYLSLTKSINLTKDTEEKSAYIEEFRAVFEKISNYNND